MRYKYKVRELGKEIVQDMEAMSLKKLRRKLDHTKEYAIEYVNKHISPPTIMAHRPIANCNIANCIVIIFG